MSLVNRIEYTVILVLCFTSTVARSQTVVIDGEIRPRTEYQNGFKTPISTANDPGIFTSQRTRLGLTFTSGLLTTQITLQDSRVFGQYATTSSEATTGIYEAWANMLLVPGGSLTVGRQPIKYDDSRLFSAPVWSITGTTHDLMLFKYSINDFQAHLGLAYNNKSETSVETFYVPGSRYRSMGYLWLSTPTYKGFTLSGIVVDEGLQDTLGLGGTAKYKKISTNQAITYGGNLKYENAAFPLSGLATAYFQSGKNFSGKTMKGKLLALKLNYNVASFLSASLGTDYLSGDKNGSTDGIQSNFKKLYGSDHTFNGYIDYWDAPLAQGLLDYYGSVTGKIGKSLSIEGGYHVFNTEYSGKNAKKIDFGRDLGSEFDLLVTYKLNTWTTVQGGYCRYFSNNNTLIAKDLVTVANTYPTVNAPQWAYVMFTIKPTFLNTASAGK